MIQNQMLCSNLQMEQGFCKELNWYHLLNTGVAADTVVRPDWKTFEINFLVKMFFSSGNLSDSVIFQVRWAKIYEHEWFIVLRWITLLFREHILTVSIWKSEGSFFCVCVSLTSCNGSHWYNAFPFPLAALLHRKWAVPVLKERQPPKMHINELS